MKVQEITSVKNATFGMFRDILTARGINEHRKAFIFGEKAVGDILADQSLINLAKLDALIIDEDSQAEGLTGGIFGNIKSVFKLKKNLFEQLDIFGTRKPIAVVGVPQFEKWDSKSVEKGCYLYLPFQDPRNVGAVLRSAAAFGVKGIILAEGAAHPFHPRSSRAASGALFLNKYFRLSGPLSAGPRFPLYGLDKAGEDISKIKFPESFVLVPGIEGPGLQAEIFISHKIGIPINPKIDSLNAAIATSIILYRWASLK